MDENNRQDPKFSELSEKKKIIHYVGWPLLVLGCVGTIVFGSLWCKARGGSDANPLDRPAEDNISLKYEEGSDYPDFDQSNNLGATFYSHIIDTAEIGKIYQFNFDIDKDYVHCNEYDILSIDFIICCGNLGSAAAGTELLCAPYLIINGQNITKKVPDGGNLALTTKVDPSEAGGGNVVYSAPSLADLDNTTNSTISIKLILNKCKDVDYNPGDPDHDDEDRALILFNVYYSVPSI